MRHLFDVRNIVGALLGIYGVVLTIAGFAPGLLREHDKGAGTTPSTCMSAPMPTGGWVSG